MDAALAAALGARLSEDLVVVDVGARWGAGERWRPFERVRVVGFDPDAEECARLNALESDDRVRYAPVALGAFPGAATLHLTVEPACSSLYPPLGRLVDERPELAVIAPVGTTTVELATLDGWAADDGLAPVDVVKLDVQGGELDVLRGAERVLTDVRLLEVEVELNPIYEGQPLFGDVDRFLRARGFVLWRLQHLVHYGLASTPSAETTVADVAYFDSRPTPSIGQGGQLYWAHAYYAADDLASGSGPLPADRAVRDACAAFAFGFGDLARSALARVAGGAHDDLVALLAGEASP